MARSPDVKVPSENDVTPPAEETLDFDEDNLRGEYHSRKKDWYMQLSVIT